MDQGKVQRQRKPSSKMVERSEDSEKETASGVGKKRAQAEVGSVPAKKRAQVAPAEEGAAPGSGTAKKKKDKKVSFAIAPPGTPRALHKGLQGLGAGVPANLVKICEFLAVREVLLLSTISKTMHTVMKEDPAFHHFFRLTLYGPLVDKYGLYQEKVPMAYRQACEAHFGAMAVVSALITSKCSACGEFGANFNVLSCSRACFSCWCCKDGGEKGRDSTSPFAICSLAFAKNHYLLRDSDVKKGRLFSLAGDDPSKAHGLMCTKMTVVLVKDAAAIGRDRYGGEQGLEDEKCARWAASEKEKPMTLETAAAQTNYFCRNQRSYEMVKVSSVYGLSTSVYIPGILSAEPTIFVTDATAEEVSAAWPSATAEKFAEGKCKIFANAVDAFSEVQACRAGGLTVVIDKSVSLGQDFRHCDQEKCKLLLDAREGMTVGETPQTDTIVLSFDVKIVGTPRGRISSSNACFWAHKYTMVVIDGLSMSTGFGVGNSPTLVLGGIAELTDCSIRSSGYGYTMLAHGRSLQFTDCTIASENFMCLHIETESPFFPSCLNLKGCSLSYPEESESWYFTNGQQTDAEKAWRVSVEKNNEIEQIEKEGHCGGCDCCCGGNGDY